MASSQATEFKNQGNKAQQEGRFDEAIDLYTKAIELDGSNHVFYSNRSASYAKKQQYELALKDAEKTVEIKPDWAKGYSRLGASLSFLDRNDEAKVAYENGLQVDPNNETLKNALDALETKEASPMNPFAQKNLEAKLAMDPRTREYLNDPAFMMMLNSVKNDPSKMQMFANDQRFMTVLSVLLGIPMDFAPNEGPPKKKEPEKQKEEEKPKTETLPTQTEALKEKDLGNAAYKLKDFAKAHEHYDKAIELDPTNIVFYTNKSAVLFEEGKYDECMELCKKAEQIGRENTAPFKLVAKPIARIGTIYHKQKDYENALKYYKQSMVEHRSPDVVKKVQEIEKLLKEMERKSYLDPEKAEAARAEGNEQFKKGDYPGALKSYSESIKRNPDDARVYSNRAACYTKLAEFGLALKDIDICLEKDSSFIKAYLRKGSICLTIKETTRAKDAYMKALELDNNCQEAREGLQKCAQQKSTLTPEERRKQAMEDPEVQAILSDPAMRMILEQMQENPQAASEHLQNPAIREKISKLMDSGILQMR